MSSPILKLPPPEEDAHNALSFMFGRGEWRNYGDVDRVVAILERYPSLAHRRFSSCHNHGVQPLCCLLMCSSIDNVEVIRKVYKMDPGATSLQGLQEDTALHFACRYYRSDDIVQFIFSQCPRALTVKNKHGQTPMDYLLVSVRTTPHSVAISPLKLLIRLCPGVVMEQSRYENLLKAALCMGCPYEVLKFIADYFPKDRTDFVVGCGTPMDLERTQILVGLLPQLRRLDIWGQHVQGAFEYLLDVLVQNKSILQLELLCLPRNILRTSQKARDSLGEVFRANSTLQNIKMHLVGDRHHKEDDGKILDTIFRGLASNVSLRKLKLGGFRFPPLESMNCLAVSGPLSCNSVTQLELGSCSIPLNSLSRIPTYFPELLSLNVNGVSPVGRHVMQRVDLTRSVVQILETGKTLECLSVAPNRAAKIDMLPVCDALRKNSVLRSFAVGRSLDDDHKLSSFLSVLEDSNTTLEEVGEISFGHGRGCGCGCGKMQFEHEKKHKNAKVLIEKIKYLLELNQCGRAIARQNNTSPDSLVQLLTEHKSLGMQYGLLRESTVLWALQGR